VVEVLTAYVRRNARWKGGPPATSADVQAILDVLRRHSTRWTANLPIDLSDTDLRAAHLEGMRLHGAHLERAHLEGAFLWEADLLDAHLEGAYLTGATGLTAEMLRRANIDGATHIDPGLRRQLAELSAKTGTP
jgi:hypothetical protein